VKKLTLYCAILKELCEYYFSNVYTLTIFPSKWYSQTILEEQGIKSLEVIVNFSKLKHIGFSEKFRFKYLSVLKTTLFKSLKISSMSINVRTLDL